MRELKPEAKRVNVRSPVVNPTVSSKDIRTVNLCSIGQGDDVGQRSGNKVRVFEVECSFYTTSEHIDVYLIQSLDGDPPVTSDFYYTPDCNRLSVESSYKYKVLRHWLGAYIPLRKAGRFYHRFPGGHLQRYDGTATGDLVGPSLYLVFVNGESTGYPVIYSCETRFTDV